jgi:O-antigen ligase
MRPQWGFFTILFLIPLESFRTLSEGFESLTVSKLLGLAVAGVYLLQWVLGKRLPAQMHSRLWGWILAWYAAALAATLFSPFPMGALGGLRTLGIAVVFLALALAAHDLNHYRLTTPWILVVSVSLSAGVAVVTALQGGAHLVSSPDEVLRTAGAAANPNHLAAMLVFALPLIAHLFAGTRGGLRLLALGMGLLCVSALILSYSRSGLVVLLFTLALVGWHYAKRLRPRHFGLVLGLAVAALMVAGTLIPGIYWSRQATVTDVTDPAIGRRASYVLVALEAVRERPLLGTGPGTFRDHFAATRYAAKYAADSGDYRRYAHNTYLEVAVGTGLVGLLCFLGIILIAMRSFVRAARDFRDAGARDLAEVTWAYLTAMSSLLVYFLFLSDVTHKLFWLLVGLSQIASLLARARRSGP